MCENTTNNELFEKLMQLQWLLHRRHQQSHAGRNSFSDPTRGQGRVLALLKLQPEISTKDLSYLLGIRQQSLSELLNKLEKNGYITRTPMETDKRVMLIKLTDKGKDARQDPPDDSELFGCLSPEEQTVFGDYLSRIIAVLEAQMGENTPEDMERWMHQARIRMGDEAFEHLMAMRGRGVPRNGRPGGRRRGQNDPRSCPDWGGKTSR
jgi:DNA-binding MarR family transcriptional regulator